MPRKRTGVGILYGTHLNKIKCTFPLNDIFFRSAPPTFWNLYRTPFSISPVLNTPCYVSFWRSSCMSVICICPEENIRSACTLGTHKGEDHHLISISHIFCLFFHSRWITLCQSYWDLLVFISKMCTKCGWNRVVCYFLCLTGEATAFWLIQLLFDKNHTGVMASASSCWYTHL